MTIAAELVGASGQVRPRARAAVTGLRDTVGQVRRIRGRAAWLVGPPWNWLAGIGLNLVLALGYLLIDPLTGSGERGWPIVVGSYFAVFVLADVTTTNVLGADSDRVAGRLASGTSLRRVLLGKNAIVLLLVALPVGILTAVLTVTDETTEALAVTLPGVLLPVLAWLGLGNLVSVALPVPARPLRERWQQRRDVRSTGRWLLALVLPYALCVGLEPLRAVPMAALELVQRWVGHGALGGVVDSGLVLLGVGLLTYLGLSGATLVLARRRGLRLA